MSELSYKDRVHSFARERVFRLDESALHVTSAAGQHTIPYADIKFIEAFQFSFLGNSSRHVRWILHPKAGAPITLTSAMRAPWRVTDRRPSFLPFVRELERRIVAVNPDLYFVEGRRWFNRAGGIGGKTAVLLTRLVRNTNPDGWASAAAWFMRHLGPRLSGHRHALEQIALAFPEKSPAERERIAVGMWDNLARTFVEYVQLDRLWDYDPARPGEGRIAIDGASMQVWRDIISANRRTLHFSLHIANWELAAIAVAKHGVRALIPYRRLKNEAMTNEIIRVRVAAGTTPLTAGPSMISEIKREFGAQPADVLGMLIDQRYVHGIEVQFFGRPTRLNPLFARLARIYDCPIYGSRIIRREGPRFGYEIVPVAPARDARGRVDAHATTQVFASLMERWIREHPEQWMWLHRMWR